MWSITLDEKLHLAPIGPNPQNVLDIGTGTGIWAIEFGSYLFSHSQQNTDFSSRILPLSSCYRNRFISDLTSLVSPPSLLGFWYSKREVSHPIASSKSTTQQTSGSSRQNLTTSTAVRSRHAPKTPLLSSAKHSMP
jgi:hypothetical protein